MAFTHPKQSILAVVLLLCSLGAEAGHLRGLKGSGMSLGLGKGLSLGSLHTHMHQQATTQEVASRISSSVVTNVKQGLGTIWDMPERKLLWSAATSRHLENGGMGGGFGKGMQMRFSWSQPARQQGALEVMSRIDAKTEAQEHAPKAVVTNAEDGSAPDRRLHQEGSKFGFAKTSINLANQANIASTLIRRAAEGRMQVASAITYTRPQRGQDSLALLAEADASSGQLSGRRRLLAGR